jgi:carbonic anhydrase/acetyltransferase-like protein (isoleucine patch superfamily)
VDLVRRAAGQQVHGTRPRPVHACAILLVGPPTDEEQVVQIPYAGKEPIVAEDAWTAPNVSLVGAVSLGSEVSVWYSAVLRGDGDSIDIGAGSNIQDGCVVHADPGFPVRLGTGVSIGHNAVVHGCTVEDDALVGMGSVVMNGAVVGRESLVAAGTVVLEGTEIPPRSLVAGVPGKVRRELSDDEVEGLRGNARRYRERRRQYAEAG